MAVSVLVVTEEPDTEAVMTVNAVTVAMEDSREPLRKDPSKLKQALPVNKQMKFVMTTMQHFSF